MPTLAEFTREASQQLVSVSDSARLDAELIISHVLQIPRSRFVSHPEQTIDARQCNEVDTLLQRRAEGEPIAYILGYKHFWDLELKVTPKVLIPRPDTELLVETALTLFAENVPMNVLDLGTGSGAIAIAIAKARPRWHVSAIDDSRQALEVARDNAARYRLANLSLQQSHWFEQLQANLHYHLILSNPPYIPTHDPHLQQGDVRFEPQQALVSGKDGLDAIRYLIPTGKDYLLSDGWLMLEHGYDQGERVRQLFIDNDYKDIQQKKDLGGHIRVTMGRV